MNGHGPQLPAGGRVLGQHGQAPVHDIRLIPMAGVDVRDGAMLLDDARLHLQVVDIPHGVAWLIPISDAALAKLRDNIDAKLARGGE